MHSFHLIPLQHILLTWPTTAAVEVIVDVGHIQVHKFKFQFQCQFTVYILQMLIRQTVDDTAIPLIRAGDAYLRSTHAA